MVIGNRWAFVTRPMTHNDLQPNKEEDEDGEDLEYQAEDDRESGEYCTPNGVSGMMLDFN